MKLNNVIFLFLFYSLTGSTIKDRIGKAGKNKNEIQNAIAKVSKSQSAGMEWLILHMPIEDLKIVNSKFLIENCELAYKARKQSSWGKNIPDSIFFQYVLPFANLNERRDDWRGDFYKRFYDIMNSSKSAYEATAKLNNIMFDRIGVKYSTKRPKADQSPYESIEAGLASCTGLSFLLVDACRSIGVPARFVGTPMWYNDSGNHSWVEIWDNGWHFTGAIEPTGDELNKVWFADRASKAVKGDIKYGIYAATWADSDLYFPMDWLKDVKTYNAIDVSDRYIKGYGDELVPIRIRVFDSKGERSATSVMVTGEDNFSFEGKSKDETCDANDHLTLMLPKGRDFIVQINEVKKTIRVMNEEIVDLKLKD